jgi:hypothetical protein
VTRWLLHVLGHETVNRARRLLQRPDGVDARAVLWRGLRLEKGRWFTRRFRIGDHF